MEIRQLEYFVMAAEFENFTHASKVLHVSQPSVTKAVQALESEFGVSLIDRNQKKVTLTFEGKAFLHHSKVILGNLEDLRQKMASFTGKNEIRLAYPEVMENQIYLPLEQKLCQRDEQFVLRALPCRNNQEGMARVDAKEAHFALIMEEKSDLRPIFFINVTASFVEGEQGAGIYLYGDEGKNNSPVKAEFLRFIYGL